MLGRITSKFSGCFSPFKSSSTSSRTPASPRAEYPKATAEAPAHGNPLSGTRPGSSPDGRPNSSTEPKSGLKPNEEKLAGYLMAKAAMHRKVEGPVLENLRAGNETVRKVRELLPLGRANVIEDIDKAEGPHPMLRNQALHKLRSALTPRGWSFFRIDPKNAFYRRQAAAGLYAQTGTCGTFAAIAAPMHAAKLPEMQDKQAVVAKVSHMQVDHSWVEIIPNGKGKDGKPILHGEDVIVDGWCKDNVAILREDGAFSQLGPDGRRDHLKHPDILNHQSGPKALKLVEKYKARIDNSPALKSVFHEHLDRFKGVDVVVPDKLLYEDTSVFSSTFRHEAGEALRKNQSKPIDEIMDIQEVRFDLSTRAELAQRRTLPEIRAIGVARTLGSDIRDAKAKAVQIHRMGKVMSEIQAVGVARSLGSNIRGAKAEAPGIIASAKEMFPAAGAEGNQVLSP